LKLIPANKILFISFDHIGDILRFTPLLRTLRNHYPRAYMTCLFPSAQAEILSHFPFVDKIIYFPHDKIRKSLKEGLDLSRCVDKYVYNLLQTLKRIHFDVVINPYGDLGGMIAGLISPKMVLGRVMTSWKEFKIFGENAAHFFYTVKREKEFRIHSEKILSDAILMILKDLGIQEENFWRKPELSLGESDRLFAASFLKKANLEEPYFLMGIQTGAMLNEKKIWSLGNFVSLINRLAKKQESLKPEVPLKVVLFGTSHEREGFEKEVIPFLECEAILAAGETKILQSAALLEKLDLLVSLDTGPMHMAAILGTPVVALFSSSAAVPQEARPFGDNHTVLIGREVKDILLEDVYQAAEKYLLDETGSLSLEKGATREY